MSVRLLDKVPLVPMTDRRYVPSVGLDVAEIMSGPEVDPPGGGVSVPGPDTVTPDGVGPTHVVVVFTGDKKPPIDVNMIMAVVLRPWPTVIEGYEVEIEKLA